VPKGAHNRFSIHNSCL